MKFLKYTLLIILLIFIIGFLYIRFAVHESRPNIVEGENPSLLAEKMLSAVDKKAWDSLSYVSWSFRGEHHFVWDKINNDALVQWEDYTVHLDPDEITGKAFKEKVQLENDEATEAIQTAWSYWCNDMFWFVAPFKIKDEGTELQIAEDRDGQKGLLVTYKSGGVTPGDAYLWYLDDSGLPTGYKMWVKIIPVGGIYTSWANWKTLPGGAKVATFHQGNISALKIDITNIKAGNDWQSLGYTESPIRL